MLKNTLLLLALFLLHQYVSAQRIEQCASMQKIEFFNPKVILSAQARGVINRNTGQFAAKRKVIIIPVVVHVIYKTAEQNISDELIQSQINILNRDYRRNNTDTADTPAPFKSVAADCEIEFCLAQQDPQGNPTNGITRTPTTINEIGNTDKFYQSAQGGKDIWDRNSYLNIWVCQIKFSGDLLGFSPLPSFNPLPDRDGVVIDYRYFGKNNKSSFGKGRTCTHEVGHWLDLYHIWGDDGGLCSGTDFVDDTPNQSIEHFGKPVFPALDSCNSNYPGTMFMNFMDYSDDAVMNMFTQGQRQRMDEAFLISFRDSLRLSKGCLPLTSENNQVQVYPNPSNGIFKIYFSLYEPENVQLMLYNFMGEILLKLELNAVQLASESLDLRNYPGGVYLLHIATNKNKIIKKIIKN